MPFSRFPIAALLAIAAVSPARADEPVNEEFFERKVRPILADRCLECHGKDKQKGGLRLDARESMLKGGDNGPAVAPGDAGKSLLVQFIRYGSDIKMPPKGKLPDEEIAVLTKWVAGGAPWPAATGVVQAGPTRRANTGPSSPRSGGKSQKPSTKSQTRSTPSSGRSWREPD